MGLSTVSRGKVRTSPNSRYLQISMSRRIWFRALSPWRLCLFPVSIGVSIIRLKYVDGDPFSVEMVFLPESQYLPVIEEHLEDQPFRKISEACGISVGKSFISSEPVLCPAEAGKLLGIPAGAPVLKFCIEIYDTRENPTACEILYTSGKRTKVQLT